MKRAELADGPEGRAELAEWYCNVVVLDRRPVFLLTHARTLFAFWMLATGKTSQAVFWREVRGHARRALDDAANASRAAGLVLDDGPDAFGKTRDRGVLGSMVDYAKMAKVIVEHRGGLATAGLPELTRLMNRTPMSRLRMDAPEQEMRRLLNAGPPG